MPLKFFWRCISDRIVFIVEIFEVTENLFKASFFQKLCNAISFYPATPPSFHFLGPKIMGNAEATHAMQVIFVSYRIATVVHQCYSDLIENIALV